MNNDTWSSAETGVQMCGQLLVDGIQKIRIGQYVEEVVSVDGPRALPDPVALRSA